MRGAISHRWSGDQPPRSDATRTIATPRANWNSTATQQRDNPIWARLDAAPAVRACIRSSPSAITRLLVRIPHRNLQYIRELILLLQVTLPASTHRSRRQWATPRSLPKSSWYLSRVFMHRMEHHKSNIHSRSGLVPTTCMGSSSFLYDVFCCNFEVCFVSSAVRNS